MWWELVIQIGLEVLDREDDLGPLLRALRTLPGLEGPGRYDMNTHGVWREIDERKMLVDALTQRTQLLEVRTEAGATLMLAMGKHGERPTAAAQLPIEVGLETITAAWGALFEVGAVRASASSAVWRERVSGLTPREALGGLPVAVMAWRGQGPALGELGGQVHWRRSGRHSELWMARDDGALGEADRAAIEAVWEKLAALD